MDDGRRLSRLGANFGKRLERCVQQILLVLLLVLVILLRNVPPANAALAWRMAGER